MPRITEPTLAQHRAKQRAAVLRAAEEVAVAHGGDALTVAAVAARAGLARPSVYAYFASVEEILAALVDEGFRRWRDTLEAATGPTTTPQDLVRAWFTAAARSAAAGNHRLATALAGVRLPDDVRATLLEGHRQTSAPLARAVAALGVGDPDAALTLVTATVNVCISRVEAGAPPDVEATRAADFTLGGLTALAART